MYEYGNNMESYDDSVEIDVKNMLGKLFFTISKYWFPMLLSIIVLCEAILSCAALIYKPKYTAYVTYVVNKSGDESVDAVVASGLGVVIEEAFGTNGFRELIEAQYVEKPEWLDSNVIVPTYDGETNVLTLTVTTNNYYNTGSLLAVVERVFPEYASQLIGTADLDIIDFSDVESDPSNAYNVLFYIGAGIFGGLFLCMCFVLIASIGRKTIRKKEDMKYLTNMALLEEIPFIRLKKRNKDTAVELNCLYKRTKNSVYGQSMQSLRHKVEKGMLQKGQKILMVTSSVQGEGKSTVAANLAILLAQKEYKVILIDADLYHPSLTTMLGIPRIRKGLVDYLRGKEKWQNCVYRDLPMDVLTGYSDHAANASMFLSEAMDTLLKDLKNEYDFIIVDTPPAAYLADASYLSRLTDAMLYVVRYEYAKKDIVEEGIRSVTQGEAEGIGYVLNVVNNTFKTEDKYGYRKYNYKYYSRKSE